MGLAVGVGVAVGVGLDVAVVVGVAGGVRVGVGDGGGVGDGVAVDKGGVKVEEGIGACAPVTAAVADNPSGVDRAPMAGAQELSASATKAAEMSRHFERTKKG